MRHISQNSAHRRPIFRNFVFSITFSNAEHGNPLPVVSEHEPDGGDAQKCERISVDALPILGQSSTPTEPRKCSLDDPPPRQDLEAFRRIGTLDDFRHEARKSFLLGLAKDGSLIAAIGEQLLQKREIPEQCAQNENAAVSVLDVGGMNDRMKQQAYRVDKNMPLLAVDLLARIIAVRINTAPPFSALFTLWLSMTAAVGLASRPAASRHFT
jgi:hypothetical protein